MEAVFVDGVGTILRMAIKDRIPVFSFPILAAPRVAIGRPSVPEFVRADFEFIGTLPDGTSVYGFKFDTNKYQLWETNAYLTHEMAQLSHARETADAQVQSTVKSLETPGLGPAVVLFDATSSNPTTGIDRRTVMGLCRRNERG